MADRVCVMRAGRIEQAATPEELYGSPATAFVAEFVGTMSRVPGRIAGDTVDVLGRRLAVRNRNGHAPGALVDVLVRPENLTVQHDPAGAGRVISKSFLGSVSRVLVELAPQTQIKVDVVGAGAAGFAAGDPVRVGVEEVPVMVTDRGQGD